MVRSRCRDIRRKDFPLELHLWTRQEKQLSSADPNFVAHQEDFVLEALE